LPTKFREGRLPYSLQFPSRLEKVKGTGKRVTSLRKPTAGVRSANLAENYAGKAAEFVESAPLTPKGNTRRIVAG